MHSRKPARPAARERLGTYVVRARKMQVRRLLCERVQWDMDPILHVLLVHDAMCQVAQADEGMMQGPLDATLRAPRYVSTSPPPHTSPSKWDGWQGPSPQGRHLSRYSRRWWKGEETGGRADWLDI